MPSNLQSLITPASKYVSDVVPRLAIAADGAPKCGKTHWSVYTTPEPVLVVTLDTGTKAVIDKAVRDKRKFAGIVELVYESPKSDLRKKEDIDAALWASWKKEWQKFKDLCEALMTDNTVRTLVVDKATDLNHLLELSHFGKLKGNQRQDVRTDMNADFHKLFWDLYKKRPDLNMVWIHDHKKVYVPTGRIVEGKQEQAWNGKYERQGHNRMSGFVDLSLIFGWEPSVKNYYTMIDPDSSFRFHNPESDEIIGRRWYANHESAPSDFRVLAEEIFPDTQLDPGYWG